MQDRTHHWLILLFSGLLCVFALVTAQASQPAGLQAAAAISHTTAGVHSATSAALQIGSRHQHLAPGADHHLHAAATGAPTSDDTPHRPDMAKRRAVAHRLIVVSTRVPDAIPASSFPLMATITPAAKPAARAATSIRRVMARASIGRPEPALRLHPGQAPPAHA